MTVKQLIKKLLDYNPNANVYISAYYNKEDFTITHSINVGTKKQTAKEVIFHIPSK